MTTTYGAQEAQDLVPVEVLVEGVNDWKALLQIEVALEPYAVKCLGKERVTVQEACELAASMNRSSRECAYFSHLMNCDFVLDEAVVSFRIEEESRWGRCTWVKDHPTYADPKHEMREWFPDATAYHMSLLDTFFVTEHAGTQRFTLQTTALSRYFAFHKAIIFHRLVFRKAVGVEQAVA